MSPGEVVVTRQEAVAIITLSAPERRNALTTSMADELRVACDAVDADDGVGAVVIRAEGPSFCAGADLETLRRIGEDPAETSRFEDLDKIYSAFLRIGALRAPTIAAIRGTAVGAGLNLALVTDLRIVAEDARLAAGFLRIGVHPGGGGMSMLQRLVGREAAAAMALFGAPIDGARAVAIGLAWEALPEDRVEARALELAAVAAADPALSRLATRTLRTEAETPLPVHVAVEYEKARQLWSLRRRSGGA
jgi:enoyl-CoA hydratase